MPKRIILLLDGTWNNWEAGDNDTNIVRLEDIIVRSLEVQQAKLSSTPSPPAAAPPSPPQSDSNTLVTSLKSEDDKDNFVFYQRGVGTSYNDRFRGGIFGQGLADNIRRAYKFLSFHYEQGAEIFIFGFSRGAFTARSVAGYVAAAGLLKREHCSLENEAAAWSYYRTPPGDRLPADWTHLTPYVHDRDQLKIDCVGVFDTVGALGIPLGFFRTRNRERYAFHDVNLSSISRVNLHAMAIDEHRMPFGATIWRRPRFKQYKTETEQVWFPGVHADIGGGYISAEKRKGGNVASLDDITLNWMLRRLKRHFPRFPLESAVWPPNLAECASAEQHESRGLQYKFFRFAYRTLANLPVTKLGFWEAIVSYDRRDVQIGERIHISALERLGQRVKSGRRQIDYRPPNLLQVLPQIQTTYASTANDAGATNGVHIVDWEGETISSSDAGGRERAQQILQDVQKRLNP